MNVFASNNVLFDGVFCRNSDDCTTVYGTRLGFEGGCRNITMQNSTLWADVAHPIFIGIHGNSKAPEVLEDLNYINIDILDHREKQVDYQGCMAINAGDNNLYAMFILRTSVLRISVRGNLSIYVSFIMKNTVLLPEEELRTYCLRIYPIPERMRNFLLLKDMMKNVR